MGMTPEQIAELSGLKDHKDFREDNIKNKDIIKDILKNDARIIHVLNNSNLSEDCPDDYVGINIKQCMFIPEIQSETQNYICFKLDMYSANENNNISCAGHITFYVFCDGKNIQTEYGIQRHDLLGYLIKDNLKWSNALGLQLKLIHDKESVTDNSYNCRTIVFEIQSTNGIYKGSNKLNTIVSNNNKKYINYGESSKYEQS